MVYQIKKSELEGERRKNPWEEICLSDYENHMKLDSVMQLQTMSTMMKKQFYQYPVRTIMVLGIAGGNGLEHINPQVVEKVFGVDINKEYLRKCVERFPQLNGVLECFCVDLRDKNMVLPHADLVVANLLIEYIGYKCFQQAIHEIEPQYVSCVIQINQDENFVSDSPYLHAFDHLDKVHHPMDEKKLIVTMEGINYRILMKTEKLLPNGKKLVQLDFKL